MAIKPIKAVVDSSFSKNGEKAHGVNEWDLHYKDLERIERAEINNMCNWLLNGISQLAVGVSASQSFHRSNMDLEKSKPDV